MVRRISFFSILLLQATVLFAQPAERRISRDQYIQTWADEAVFQMHQTGIPASITLAQGILESANGNSALAKYANNHFGIKCHDWTGPSYTADDDRKNECFRKYKSASDSYRDHAEFLTGRSRYAFIFEYESDDYKAWAHGLKKAGYATNPKYAYLLIDLIEAHQLYKYDKRNLKPQQVKTEGKIEIAEVEIKEQKRIAHIHDNGIKYVKVGQDDTFYKVAKSFDLSLNQLYKYNDLSDNAVLMVGDILYVQPKRNKSKKVSVHYAVEGETLHDVSQQYGIKLKKIKKRNNISENQKLTLGQQVLLR